MLQEKPTRSRRLIISLTDAEHAWLKRAAAAQASSMGDILRRLSRISERATEPQGGAHELKEY
jgi:hypothetical protein